MIQTDDSRYATVETYQDEAGRLASLDREPFRFRERSDTILHTVVEGDTWATLAQRYYSGLNDRACGLWWVIADFQPQPVVDPTLALDPGRTVYVPSQLTVRNEVLGVKFEVCL